MCPPICRWEKKKTAHIYQYVNSIMKFVHEFIRTLNNGNSNCKLIRQSRSYIRPVTYLRNFSHVSLISRIPDWEPLPSPWLTHLPSVFVEPLGQREGFLEHSGGVRLPRLFFLDGAWGWRSVEGHLLFHGASWRFMSWRKMWDKLGDCIENVETWK